MQSPPGFTVVGDVGLVGAVGGGVKGEETFGIFGTKPTST